MATSIKVRVITRGGYSAEVENPLITDQHNAVNDPGLCLVRGPGDPFEGNAVCAISEVCRMEAISE